MRTKDLRNIWKSIKCYHGNGMEGVELGTSESKKIGDAKD